MSVLESIAQDHVGVSCWRSAADKSYALMMQADLLERRIMPPQTKVYDSIRSSTSQSMTCLFSWGDVYRAARIISPLLAQSDQQLQPRRSSSRGDAVSRQPGKLRCSSCFRSCTTALLRRLPPCSTSDAGDSASAYTHTHQLPLAPLLPRKLPPAHARNEYPLHSSPF